MPQRRKVVITGGAHAGKTTLIDSLKARGYAVVTEAAIQLIREMEQRMGAAEQRLWHEKNHAEFQERCVEKMLLSEAEADKSDHSVIFYDRGVIDALGYCALSRVAPP